jgi:hypothetical protein
MTADPTPVTMEKITAKQAREQSESCREVIIEYVVKDIYRQINDASKIGLTSLRYTSSCYLPPAWQTVHIFQPLIEELTQNGYSVSSEKIEIHGTDCIQSIEIKWD